MGSCLIRLAEHVLNEVEVDLNGKEKCSISERRALGMVRAELNALKKFNACAHGNTEIKVSSTIVGMVREEVCIVCGAVVDIE